MSVQFHKADPVELEFAFRAMPDGSSTFEGYAAVFNKPSKVIHDQFARTARGYRETILPGAFLRSLGTNSRKTFVVDHDDSKMVSSMPSGPLRLAEDSRGLHVESPWPRTHYTDSVRALHEAGERLGMSMLFVPLSTVTMAAIPRAQNQDIAFWQTMADLAWRFGDKSSAIVSLTHLLPDELQY